MRHFQVNTLCTEDGTKTISERVYADGPVEYWALMMVGFCDPLGRNGHAQMPFKIDVTAPVFPDQPDISRMRDEAFANFEASFEACKEGAEHQVKEQVGQAARKERSKIILANAVQ